MMKLLPNGQKWLKSRLDKVLIGPKIIPTDVILYNRVDGGVDLLTFEVIVFDQQRIQGVLADFIQLKVIFSRCKDSQFQVKMMLFYLVLQDMVAETKLNKFEIIHELLVLGNILHNVVLVLIYLQVVDNIIELLQFIDIAGVELLAVQSSQYFDK